jgi:hypothetical protein
MKKNKNDTEPKNVGYNKEFYKDKDCFRCGKKGNPKEACTVKMVPADEENPPSQHHLQSQHQVRHCQRRLVKRSL